MRDVHISGTVRITVAPPAGACWPETTHLTVSGWVPPGSGLGALVDLGALEYIDDGTVRRIAHAVAHARRVSVVGDDHRAVQDLCHQLPAAIAQAHRMAVAA